MKFIVSSSSLLKHLQTLSGVFASSNTLPILDNFLFELNKKDLTITASDLETTISTRLDIEGKERGTVCIPSKMLLDTLKTFSDQPLTFSVDEKTFGIEISSDYGKYKLTGFNGDEFPKNPVLDNPTSVEASAQLLSDAINKTIFATGNDDMRPVMMGIFCEFTSDSLRFVATDAHKLVRYTRKDVKAGKPASFIIPKKPLNLLKNVLLTTNAPVTMEYNEANVRFSFDGYSMIARLIEGKYPNYEAVIPKSNPNRLTIGRVPFLASIKRVSIFSNKTTHQVRLKIQGSELTISAEDLDYANEANERLTCSFEGDDMEIGFNSRFVLDMLSNLNTEEVSLELSAPNRAGILTPVNNTNKEEDILMLVMPVMLNS
jgi:DNA polymerase III subunit beta